MREKPKRRTDEDIRKNMHRVKTRNIQRAQTLKSGDFHSISAQFDSFAEKWGVDWEDVRLITSNAWGYATRLTVKTPETDDEKFRRLRHDADNRHRSAVYDWEQERERERRARAQAAYQAEMQATVSRNAQKCCPANCCCRKS